MRRFVFELMLALAACYGMAADAVNAGQHKMAPRAEFAFSHVGIHDGLPESYIGSVFRLPDGRLGIRANDFMVWDGTTFRRYPEPETPFYAIDHGPMNFNQYIDGANRLWMKKRNELRVFDLNRERYIDNVDSLLRLMGVDEHVNNLFVDTEGTFWFSTSSGISSFDLEQGLKSAMRKSDHNYPGSFMGVQRSIDGRYGWLVFSSGDVLKWDMKNGSLAERYDFMRGRVKLGEQVEIQPLDDARIAVMTDNCVGIFDDDTRQFTPVLPVNDNPAHKYTSMGLDPQGNLWVSRTKHGMYVVSPATMAVNSLRSYKLTSGERLVNDIQHICADSISGGMWLALHNNGILYYNGAAPDKSYVEVGRLADFKDEEEINTMLRRADGSLVMGSNKGLYLLGDDGEKPKRIVPELEGKVCRTLFEDRDGNLWIGTFADGLYCLEGDKLRHVLYSTTDYHDNVNYNNVRTITQDQRGQIWIAVYGSVGRIDPATGTFTPMTDSDKVFSEFGLAGELLPDNTGRLLGASEKGTFVYDPTSGVTTRLFADSKIPTGMRNPAYIRANSVAQDREGNLWVGTHTGLYVLRRDGSVVNYGIDNGFANPVHKVAVDRRDRVWVLTATNVYKADLLPEGESGKGARITLHSYLDEKSILRNDQMQFNLTIDGTSLYVPAQKGILRLDISPDTAAVAPRLHSPLFNYLHVAEQEVGVGDEFNGRVLYDYVLGDKAVIELNHDESSLSIGFVNLDYSNLLSATYRYMLEGLDHEWNEVTFRGSQGQVNYNRLPPGTYRLRVSSVGNGDTVSPEAVFTIVVRPPWWLSTRFKIIWAILAVALVVTAAIILRRRTQRRLQQALDAQEQARRKEVEEMKLRFFTNISHELRTPLTLIITPLQSMIEKMPESSPLLPKLTGIQQNARNLLMQVNQLLDFRKLEVGADKFDPKPCNVVDLTRVAVSSFMPLAAERDIALTLNLPDARVIVNGDKQKLSRIITNLVSNAIKYTPDGGKIQVSVKADNEARKVCLSVSDTGIGIPEKEVGRIFDRFFQASNSGDGAQVNSSSGIGLHMAKEYAQMHGGEITVESQIGAGSTFTVMLPMAQPEAKPVAVSGASDGDTRPVILLAEDNDEFRSFMLGELSEHYRVVGVADGSQALAQAKAIDPAIIVSDVMMPVMDGIELTRAIKTDIETSHIPVVLLTAHANEANETVGYEAGADAYISKPFNMHVLLTRISNLIEQQHGRWEKFEKHLEVNPSEISITSPDEELIEKALKCVEEHIDDTEFSVDTLSEGLAMSKATLYRKLQAITGQTPNNFIRTIRLKRAAQMLRTSSLSVSEIAYRTGFSVPKYFSRLFKEEFGVLPTDYRKTES